LKTTENIVKDFRKGNSEQRLSLFLQYGQLRPAFEEIEKEESATLKTESAKSQQKITPFRQFIRWCYSLMS
jgi:hypothetical protein